MEVITDMDANTNRHVLRRSNRNRVFFGVCGGLADFFGIDAFWFRLSFLIALIPGGVPGGSLYLLLALIVPSD
jgi:phage shock protein PspC (stress-responsive transcriptional regulator)